MEETYADLYERHSTPALRLAVLLVGDRSKAEDLVADAFTQVLPHWRRGAVLDFGPYLRTAVVNGFRGTVRRKGWRDRDLVVADDVDEAVDLADLVTDRAALGAALRQLPERQRAAIVLRYFEDLPEREVAELLDCPVGTVKATVSRGLVKLRSLLEEHTNA
jgi:RNA polymerase sigma-70 factor (sigma-E family)